MKEIVFKEDRLIEYFFKLYNIEQKWALQEPKNWQAGQYFKLIRK